MLRKPPTSEQILILSTVIALSRAEVEIRKWVFTKQARRVAVLDDPSAKQLE